jgi:hypothetical protein
MTKFLFLVPALALVSCASRSEPVRDCKEVVEEFNPKGCSLINGGVVCSKEVKGQSVYITFAESSSIKSVHAQAKNAGLVQKGGTSVCFYKENSTNLHVATWVFPTPEKPGKLDYKTK